jgi:hypothetical protein
MATKQKEIPKPNLFMSIDYLLKLKRIYVEKQIMKLKKGFLAIVRKYFNKS